MTEASNAPADPIREALAPFAAFYVRGAPDAHVITQGSAMAQRQLTMGDCRKAQEALSATREEGGVIPAGPGDPAYEQARAKLVAFVRDIGAEDSRNGYTAVADRIAAGEAVDIPSWVAMTLLATQPASVSGEGANAAADGDKVLVPREPTEAGEVECRECVGTGCGTAKAELDGNPYCLVCSGSGLAPSLNHRDMTIDECAAKVDSFREGHERRLSTAPPKYRKSYASHIDACRNIAAALRAMKRPLAATAQTEAGDA